MIRHLVVPKRFVIVRADSSDNRAVRGDEVSELVEMPDKTLPGTLSQRYGVDVELGEEVEIAVSHYGAGA